MSVHVLRLQPAKKHKLMYNNGPKRDLIVMHKHVSINIHTCVHKVGIKYYDHWTIAQFHYNVLLIRQSAAWMQYLLRLCRLFGRSLNAPRWLAIGANETTH